MAEHGLRRLPVVDSDGVLRGLLSWTDLVGAISDHALGRLVARINAARAGKG
jgi:CBS domain-containing protein